MSRFHLYLPAPRIKQRLPGCSGCRGHRLSVCALLQLACRRRNTGILLVLINYETVAPRRSTNHVLLLFV